MDDPIDVLGTPLRAVNHLHMLTFQPRGRADLFDERGHFKLGPVATRIGPVASLRDKFTAIVLKEPGADCTALVFYTGKMSVMGRAPEAQKMHFARRYLGMVSEALEADPPLELDADVRLANGVNTWKRPGRRLNLTALTGQEDVQYEPEQMNKVVWRPFRNSSIAINLFPAGGVVVVGLKTPKDRQKVARFLRRELPGLMTV